MATKKNEESQQQQRMDSKIKESSKGHQGDAAVDDDPVPPPPTPAGLPDRKTPSFRARNSVLKSGPLFLATKGIGWTSWKKRWFILTRTSVVFFRSDPDLGLDIGEEHQSAVPEAKTTIPPKGNAANLTLGGIDLSNSGSHITGFEGRNEEQQALIMCLSNTAETLEDLYEWKAAFENALSQAPSSAPVMEENGILRNDKADAVDGSKDSVNNEQPVRSTVIGKPILFALEDADGAPTFLEKALRYLEEHGTKAEGVLRLAADVEDVKRRIQEYEQAPVSFVLFLQFLWNFTFDTLCSKSYSQLFRVIHFYAGKTELTSEEDPHVIADCVKYVIRELPSSPVPASCCNALLEACRSPGAGSVNAMRVALLDTFPEPNRRLLQRILKMMQAVASNITVNRMSSSAVAACMAPLLLRPLLSGDCELEIGIDTGDDTSLQLLQAAAAANQAQAIVTTLLEEYDIIFGEGNDVSSHLYSETEESGSESEEATDDDCGDATHESDVPSDDEHVASGTGRKSSHPDSDYSSSSSAIETNKFSELPKGVQGVTKLEDKVTHQNQISSISKSTSIGNEHGQHVKRRAVWGWAVAKKKLSMERIDSPRKEETKRENLEAEKSDLQKRLTEEKEGKTIIDASLEKQKKTLHERRLALQIDVSRLEEELQRERDKRTSLEAGLIPSEGPVFLPDTLDEKTKTDLKDIAQAEADVNNLKEKVDDLRVQLNQLLEQNSVSVNDTSNQHRPNHQAKMKDKPKDTEAALKQSGSKDKYVDKIDCENEIENENYNENEKKQEPSSANKQNINCTRAADTVARNPPALSNAKKYALKGEGVNSPTSALSKLTTRLKFLKERRGQITKETEKGDRSSLAVPSPDKTKETQPIQVAQNEEKTGGPDISQ
ncbi:hypothetical protein V6N11_017850 [Hibiscus sabdariffa]|uniref:Rho GTPase-activating protein REN1-like n=1 Tax=Hibiscus sabdariffa TaxID=183260 RepID=A0ABR2T607_9ROSI